MEGIIYEAGGEFGVAVIGDDSAIEVLEEDEERDEALLSRCLSCLQWGEH